MVASLINGVLQLLAQLCEPIEPLLISESLSRCVFQWHRVSDPPPKLVIALINFGASSIPIPCQPLVVHDRSRQVR